MTRTQRPADRFITEMHLVDVQQAQGPILLWEDTMQLDLITSWVTIFRKKNLMQPLFPTVVGTVAKSIDPGCIFFSNLES